MRKTLRAGWLLRYKSDDLNVVIPIEAGHVLTDAASDVSTRADAWVLEPDGPYNGDAA